MIGEKVPFELIERLSSGDCVIFVGAGLSIAAGMPGWDGLLKYLSNEINSPKEANPLAIVQIYESVHGRVRLEKTIRNLVDSTGKQPTDNHKLIGCLGNLRHRPIFVTTNYDDLLERTLKEIGLKREIVVSDDDLAKISPNSIPLIKLHGDSERTGITATLIDYLTLYDRIPLVINALTYWLTTKTFLFVGYSSRDIDLQQLQAKVSFRLWPHVRKSYAVINGISDFDRRCLECFGVVPIDIHDWCRGDEGIKLTSFLLDIIKLIVIHNNKNKDLSMRVYEYREARKLVPKALIKQMKEKGRSLRGCIDFLTHAYATESGQYNWQQLPDLRPHSGNNEHNENIKLYYRQDKDRNIHQGLAFFR